MDFHKYQGAGNDFVMIDNRARQFALTKERLELTIKALCDRHFGVGADGLILLENDPGHDFRMVYFNADGKEGSFCGNGSRCAVAFAHQIKKNKTHKARFIAIDGTHHAEIIKYHKGIYDVVVDLNDTERPKKLADNKYYIDTGSPHLLIFHDNLASLNVTELGRKIRYSDEWAEKGVNVNFVQVIDDQTLAVRTYERGVEQETLSCGTGVTAAALTYSTIREGKKQNAVIVQTEGGSLMVSFSSESKKVFKKIKLRGPAEWVFSGKVSI